MKRILFNELDTNISLEEAFDFFDKYNKYKNLSPRTLSYYRDCLKYFREILWYRPKVFRNQKRDNNRLCQLFKGKNKYKQYIY